MLLSGISWIACEETLRREEEDNKEEEPKKVTMGRMPDDNREILRTTGQSLAEEEKKTPGNTMQGASENAPS